MKYILPPVFLLISLLTTCIDLQAGTLPVSSLADAGSGSLREAIELANPGDTILLMINGDIQLDSQLVIIKDVYIQGMGVSQNTLLGKAGVRHFFVDDSTSFELSGFTLRNGDFSTFISNSPKAGGGFSDGGSIKCLGNMKLNRVLFDGNRATIGGAISILNSSDSIGTVEISNCAFINNLASASDNNPVMIDEAGGAVYMDVRESPGGFLRVSNSTFSGNSSGILGGGFCTVGNISGGTDVEFNHCTFAQNTSRVGGGLANIRFAAIRMSNCIIADNEAIGGVDISGSLVSRGRNIIKTLGNEPWVADPTDSLDVDPLLTDLAFFGDLPTHGLGCLSPAVDAGDPNDPLLEDQKGQARIGLADLGAHERNAEADLQIANTNDNGFGSLRLAIALACDGDTLSFGSVTGRIDFQSTLVIEQAISIEGNPSMPVRFDGGDSLRLFDITPSGSLSLQNLGLQHGHPELFGGGAIRNQGSLVARGCTFSENKATSGGAIGNYSSGGRSAIAQFNNCTFSGNEALDLDGGAIDNRFLGDLATVLLFHCTVVQNTAANKGGGIKSVGGSVDVTNTIIALNQAQAGENDLGGDIIASNGHNLIQDSLGSSLFIREPGDIFGVNPLLDPLGNYEGPTLTHRLQTGSPAIDAGNNDTAAEFDQRGFPRIFNTTTDIGAYEFDPATVIDPSPSQEILLYPNPASDLIRLDMREQTGGEFYLLDSQGRLVFQQKIEGNQASIALGNLPRGLYLWKLGTASGKLILQ
ncbi:MAG: T9SS type A sorting domain-containing protein [Bacteroidota bacterium]